MFNKTIQNVDDIREFFMHLIHQEKLNFHPDTDFSEYVNLETGKATFNSKEISQYNKLMDNSFSICERKNIDIHDLSFGILKNLSKV